LQKLKYTKLSSKVITEINNALKFISTTGLGHIRLILKDGKIKIQVFRDEPDGRVNGG